MLLQVRWRREWAVGGPIAHLTYLREEFVQRRSWLDEAHFAPLLAVCQFLPGLASSKMGFAIGLFRSGWRGALTAFAAFTLPSALLMFGFAVLAPHLHGNIGRAAVHGLKLAAVVVMHGPTGHGSATCTGRASRPDCCRCDRTDRVDRQCVDATARNRRSWLRATGWGQDICAVDRAVVCCRFRRGGSARAGA